MKWTKKIKLPDWSEDVEWALRREHALGLYGWSVICLIIITVIWLLVVHYAGRGWVTFFVNIGGFLVSVFLAYVAMRALKVFMQTLLAYLCALATWAVVVLLLRSLIAAWLS